MQVSMACARSTRALVRRHELHDHLVDVVHPSRLFDTGQIGASAARGPQMLDIGGNPFTHPLADRFRLRSRIVPGDG